MCFELFSSNSRISEFRSKTKPLLIPHSHQSPNCLKSGVKCFHRNLTGFQVQQKPFGKKMGPYEFSMRFGILREQYVTAPLLRFKVRNKKIENFLLPNMIELVETNRMSHFPPFYDAFFRQKINFKNWILHSAVICGPELCKRDGIMKTSLATNIDGYPLRLALMFE